MRVLRGFSFFIRLLKSKAQIGLGRYEGFFCAGRFWGVGLSLNSLWSIGVAPVRGGTYFLCRGKESRQRKPLYTASL
jgi:hypothetical protein